MNIIRSGINGGIRESGGLRMIASRNSRRTGKEVFGVLRTTSTQGGIKSIRRGCVINTRQLTTTTPMTKAKPMTSMSSMTARELPGHGLISVECSTRKMGPLQESLNQCKTMSSSSSGYFSRHQMMQTRMRTVSGRTTQSRLNSTQAGNKGNQKTGNSLSTNKHNVKDLNVKKGVVAKPLSSESGVAIKPVTVFQWEAFLKEFQGVRTAMKGKQWSEVPAKMMELMRGLMTSLMTFNARQAGVVLRATYVGLQNKISELDFQTAYDSLKREFNFYVQGLKLLREESIFTWSLIQRHFFTSDKMTTRERDQLWRTVRDLVKLGPFIILLLLPGSGIVLPMVARFFPNTLPSTFLRKVDTTSSLTIKRDVAQYLKFAVREVMEDTKANEQLYSVAREKEDEVNENDVDMLMHKLKTNQLGNIGDDQILTFLQRFTDDYIIDNLPLSQLFYIGQFTRVSVHGRVGGLRERLKTKLKTIRNDDKLLALDEAYTQLDAEELKKAVHDRRIKEARDGDAIKRLSEWIHLTTNNVPVSVVILGRIGKTTQTKQ